MARAKDAIPKTPGGWRETLPSEMELGPFCNKCQYLEHEGRCDKTARPCTKCGHEYNERRDLVLPSCACQCHDGPRMLFGVELEGAA